MYVCMHVCVNGEYKIYLKITYTINGMAMVYSYSLLDIVISRQRI